MIVRDSERNQSVARSVHEHETGDQAIRGRSDRDRPLVRESHGHVKSEWLAHGLSSAQPEESCVFSLGTSATSSEGEMDSLWL